MHTLAYLQETSLLKYIHHDINSQCGKYFSILIIADSLRA